MTNKLFLILAIAAPAVAQKDDGPLKDSYQSIRSMSECRDVVGIELSYSYPLPALTPKGLRFRQMFYRTHSARRADDPHRVYRQ